MRNYVFIDESIRDSYVMAAVIVPINRLGDYRKAMAGLRTMGSLAFHMKNEKPSIQKHALNSLLSFTGAEFYFARKKLSETSQPRLVTLELALKILKPGSQWTIVLDRSSSSKSDQALISRLGREWRIDIAFSHSSRYEDVGLWGSDILAWAISTKTLPRPKEYGVDEIQDEH